MPQAFGTFQKLSHQKATQKSGIPAPHEDENLTDPKATLSLVEHASGDALHRSVLQLQRTIGNRAVSELVSQRSTPTTYVQRVIAMEASGLPVLATLFNDAFTNISAMVNVDFYARFAGALPADHPVKNKTFQQAWAIKTMRPTMREAAAKELSPESIDFLQAVETYKEAPTVDKAVQIYNDFIRVGAATQINLSQAARLPYDAANTALTAAPATRGRR
ncbi:MAG: hypothetical protein ABI690_22045 [Chloroflexota bacterium]